MNPRTGLILRLLGPLIEIVCILLLKRQGEASWLILGLPVEYLLYAGMALGLLLVVVGLTLVRPPSPKSRESGERDN